MHIDKAKKRIAKLVKAGFKGYPQISIAYFGSSKDCANEVVIQLMAEEGGAIQEQRFTSTTDVRADEVVQSMLVKIIERAEVKTVLEVAGVTTLDEKR
ncbi:hypothetical protein [Rheinheimera sp. MMS21-TC3]|uniref:hypothetical protein n=1 Tax=Rheinheimera sp. MMS21-TC3 TaxID=3072790 RepID=UPI0028C45C49|nr:hypothetical protein [Rheinheimera sp. MMS21-TC3]WNO59419.1 hypothetical protein RDV63_00180 [Rheinheimera sp. MMS21-TC3]